MGITAINGVAITASLSLSASNTVSAQSASTITVTDTATGVGPYYVMFADGTTGNRAARVDSSTLTYNSSTNTLTTTASFALTSSTALTATVGANTTAAIQQYLLWTPSYAGGGGTQQVIISSSNSLTYIPSTGEFRAGLINNLAGGTQTTTSDANLTIDAALTQSVTWIASLTATRSLIINNLADGRSVNVYIRNTNASQRQIIFSGSATTSGHVLMNMSVGAGIASATIQNITQISGTMLVRAFNVGGNLVGGVI
jgi:hypothetical protein